MLRAPETVKDVEDQTRNVGRLLGRKDKAESLIGTMMNYIRDTESLRFARRDEPKKTVAVYNQNGLYGKSKTLVADMLTYVVVDNAAIKSGVRLTMAQRRTSSRRILMLLSCRWIHGHPTIIEMQFMQAIIMIQR